MSLERVRELELELENSGFPHSCDWGGCDRVSVGWARCWRGCPEHADELEAGVFLPPELGGPFRVVDDEVDPPWLPVCRAAIVVAAETGHDVRLLGEVMEGLELERGTELSWVQGDAGAWVERFVPGLIAAEAELRGELAVYRVTRDGRRRALEDGRELADVFLV